MSLITPDFLQSRASLMPAQESGTYKQQTSPGVFTSYAVSGAWYREAEIDEKQPSSGVYAAYYRHWFIPRNQLSVIPALGDIWQSDSNRPYTVLDIGRAGGQQVWDLTTVDLVIAANLCNAIDIQRPNITRDAANVTVRTWPGTTTYAALACRIQIVDAKISRQRDLRGFRGNVQIYLSQQVTLGPEDRVQVTGSGKIYQILGYHGPQRIDELPVIDAEIVP